MQQKKLTHKITSYPPHLSLSLPSMTKILKLEKESEDFPSKIFFPFVLAPNARWPTKNKITKINKNERENQTKNKLKQNK